MCRSLLLILSLLLLLSLFSCSHSSDKLETAELLMDIAPDSSLNILQKLKPNIFTARSDKALYALLKSQALDKHDIKVESDSLISIATKYYSEEDPIHAAYAWFYMARCANNRGNANVQADALLKAQEFAIKTNNYKLQGLVYGDKADMYKNQQQLDSSIFYNKCAYRSFKRIGDDRNSIIGLLNIGGNYLYNEKLDSAINYFLIAKRIAKHSNDTLIISTIFRNLGTVYFQKKNYKVALNYFQSVPLTHIPIYDCNKWYLIASVFSKIGQFDSTDYYLSKINQRRKMKPEYYQLWQTIYEKRGDSNKALYYAKCGIAATDSLYKRRLDISFAGMEKKYKYQSLQISNQELIIKNNQKNIFLLLTLFILSLGLIFVLFWRNRIKDQQLTIQKQLLKQEMNLVEKEKENCNLLELQLKMQNILLSNVEQYRKHSIKRPNTSVESRGGISPILNRYFHEELIASMDIQYNSITKRLIERFPDLTERDILVCCLLVAGFDTGMIASILDVKIESITKHRYRLRTKLRLQNSENLVEYISYF